MELFVDSYFQQNYDCTGLRGLSALQKVVAAMRILAYGLLADIVDEYVQITQSIARESFEHFCCVVISAFAKEYHASCNLHRSKYKTKARYLLLHVPGQPILET
jgi:hypothetical protein